MPPCVCVWGRERVVIVGERERENGIPWWWDPLNDISHSVSTKSHDSLRAWGSGGPDHLRKWGIWWLSSDEISPLTYGDRNLGNYPPPHSHLIKPLSKSYIRQMDGWGACSVCSLADKDCMLMEGKEKKTLALLLPFCFSGNQFSWKWSSVWEIKVNMFS